MSIHGKDKEVYAVIKTHRIKPSLVLCTALRSGRESASVLDQRGNVAYLCSGGTDQSVAMHRPALGTLLPGAAG